MIFTSLSPNTEPDDIKLALKTLVSPWQWYKKNHIQELEQAFKDYLPALHAVAFQSGRNALYALLKSLDLKDRDEVLLQSYTCVAVPEPVLWVGAKPVYIDVLDDFTIDPISLRKKITAKSKVLIIQHTFGTPAKLDEILAIARQYNLFIIEDCAHALGGSYHGHKLGTFGDAAFFSFGRDKVISSVFGGMAVINNKGLAEKVRKIESSFEQASVFYIIQQLKHPLILSAAKKTYNFFSLGKAILEVSKRLRLISKAVQKIELKGGKPSFFAKKYPPALAILALQQFKKLEKYNTHRMRLADIYSRALEGEPLQLPTFANDTVPVILRYTVLVADPHEIVRKARLQEIELGDWYWNSIAPKNVDYKKIGYDPLQNPNTEKLALHSLNLPTHIGIKESDAKRIAEFLIHNL